MTTEAIIPGTAREELTSFLDHDPDEGTPEQIEAAWIEEAKRRVAEIDRGDATLVSSEGVHEGMIEILERAQSRRADDGREHRSRAGADYRPSPPNPPVLPYPPAPRPGPAAAASTS